LLLRCKVKKQGTIFDKCSQVKTHADDVVIMGRRLEDVEEAFA
jgi:hypothetical protein